MEQWRVLMYNNHHCNKIGCGFCSHSKWWSFPFSDIAVLLSEFLSDFCSKEKGIFHATYAGSLIAEVWIKFQMKNEQKSHFTYTFWIINEANNEFTCWRCCLLQKTGQNLLFQSVIIVHVDVIMALNLRKISIWTRN